MDQRRRYLLYMLLELWHLEMTVVAMMILFTMYEVYRKNYERKMLRQRSAMNHETRLVYLDSIVNSNDIECINQLRMDRRTFGILCELLQMDGKLKQDGLVTVEEQVCIFLHILAHHVKNRTIRNRFKRSGETISRYFNVVLNGVLRLQGCLLKMPEPVSDNCTDTRWKWFKNCLGALGGTCIKVRVPESDKPRYRTRKGEIATNVLGVCSQDMKFVFVYPGWEGSASNSRVLHDALSRPTGLKVPTGYYYLVDGGYTNCEGFLAPYKEKKYHLSEWKEGCLPQNYEEFFNMKHASARNVIERCFGLLKMRWGILRSPSFYPISTQCRIITACCLLHNLIRREMPVDPLEHELDEVCDNENEHDVEHGGMVATMEESEQCTTWRKNLAMQMYNNWLVHRGP